MAAAGGAGGPTLADFLTVLDDRLRVLSAEGLRAVVVRHAERLPVSHRLAFLDMFADPVTASSPSTPALSAQLLCKIDAFVAEVTSGDDEQEYGDSYRFTDEQDPAWVREAEELFADVAEVFIAGDLATARTAYERLLGPFGLGQPYGPLVMWRLESTDEPETLARYLRCVYETTPVEARAAAVHRAWLDLPGGWDLTLAQVSGTRREPLPELNSFLPEWVECLISDAGGLRRPPSVRLVVEATTLGGGGQDPAALATLARRPGAHQGGLGLAWIDALVATDDLDGAGAAARETLERPGLGAGERAVVADRLAGLEARRGDPAAEVWARRRAWSCERTRSRLLGLVAASRAADQASEILAAEAADLVSSGQPVDRLGCELLLVAGRIDEAVDAVSRSAPLGWHRDDHPGPIVLPVLWALALGRVPAPDEGHLGVLFAGIDHSGRSLPSFDAPLMHEIPVGPGHGLSLTGLLREIVPRFISDAARRDGWLGVAAEVADKRINAIVSGKHRGAYHRAAGLAYAHAETLCGLGRSADAADHLAIIRARFPRHVAFRGELDAAADASTLGRAAAAGS